MAQLMGLSLTATQAVPPAAFASGASTATGSGQGAVTQARASAALERDPPMQTAPAAAGSASQTAAEGSAPPTARADETAAPQAAEGIPDPDTPTGPPPAFSMTPLELGSYLQVALARLNAAAYDSARTAAQPAQAAAEHVITGVTDVAELGSARAPAAPAAEGRESRPASSADTSSGQLGERPAQSATPVPAMGALRRFG
ncbi:hypothetical protein FGG78_25220 [Thioclava sp. BHET1]|nr:hypothetical protein FGG78_25220 [Thioclava sp. BHET1]